MQHSYDGHFQIKDRAYTCHCLRRTSSHREPHKYLARRNPTTITAAARNSISNSTARQPLQTGSRTGAPIASQMPPGPRAALSKNTDGDSLPIFITRIRFLIASAGDVGAFEVGGGAAGGATDQSSHRSDRLGDRRGHCVSPGITGSHQQSRGSTIVTSSHRKSPAVTGSHRESPRVPGSRRESPSHRASLESPGMNNSHQ